MRRRTRARELALQMLYQHDLRGPEVLEDLEDLLAESGKSEEVTAYARELVLGTAAERDEADREISAVAAHWDLSRMAAVDRNILRMSVYELIHRPDVPPKVVINEAIELAKKYSTQQSGAFVNGILDRIRRGLAEEGRLPAPLVSTGRRGGDEEEE